MAELYEAELKKTDSTIKDMSKDFHKLDAKLFNLTKKRLPVRVIDLERKVL